MTKSDNGLEQQVEAARPRNRRPSRSSARSPAALRAIARKPDLEVDLSRPKRPGLIGGKARLPEPPRKLAEREAAIVRGNADSIALRARLS